jgi:hypothetical protein
MASKVISSLPQPLSQYAYTPSTNLRYPLYTMYTLHTTHCNCFTLHTHTWHQFTLHTATVYATQATHCNSLRDTLHPHCNTHTAIMQTSPDPYTLSPCLNPPLKDVCVNPLLKDVCVYPLRIFFSPPFRPLIYSGHNKPRPVYFIALSKPYPQGCVLVFRPLIYSGHNIYIPSDSCITYNTQ